MRGGGLVKEWLAGFLIGHISRHPGAWPAPDSPDDRRMWSTWLRALIEINASRDEAEQASDLMGDEPIQDQPGVAVDIIQGLRRQAQAASKQQALAADRDTARAASWDCPHCRGEGQVVVYDHRFDGSPSAMLDCTVRGEVTQRPFPMVVVAHCVCPHGRWLRSKVDRDLLGRIPDLGCVLTGSTRWQLQDPTEGEPIEVPVGNWREIARRLAGDLAELMAARGGER